MARIGVQPSWVGLLDFQTRFPSALGGRGRLVLLEYRAEDPDVPIRPEHKMTKAQVKLEVEHEGFRQQRVYDDLPRQHLIVFTRP